MVDEIDTQLAIAELKAEVAQLRREMHSASLARETQNSSRDEPGARRTLSRSGLLKAAALGAAGILGMSELGGPSIAEAADGSAVVLGDQTNGSTAGTGLTAIPPMIGNGLAVLLTVDNTTSTFAGATGISSSGNLNGSGVQGQANSASAYGVYGTSDSGYGVVGGTSSGIDLWANGTGRLLMNPQLFVGAPTTGTHAAGEIVVDAAGTEFICVAGGTPGTWKQVSTTDRGLQIFAAGARVFHQAMTPGQIVDPVDATMKSGGGPSGVPAGARAAYCAVQSYGVGTLTLFPHGVAPPAPANWTNNGTAGVLYLSYMLVPLDASGKFGLRSNNITGNCYVDAWGYLL